MNDKPRRPVVLCLVNAAAYSRTYFSKLAPKLEELGYDVRFALDSHLSDHVYADGSPIPGASYFTDFLRARAGTLPVKSRSNQTWASLFSDFDRYLTFDVNPPNTGEATFCYDQIPAHLDSFFDEILERISPDAVLYEPVSNSFAVSAYRMASERKIPFLSLSPSRIPGRIEISTTGALADSDCLGRKYDDFVSRGIPEDVREIADTYLASIDRAIPDYMKTNGLDQLSLAGKYLNAQKLRHLMRLWKYSKHHEDDWRFAYQHGDPLRLSSAYAKRALKRRFRHASVSRLFETDPPAENFVLYPLHFHPEASTSILAPDYVDELSIIKSIAFRLPVHAKLYVKEHPSAVALQPRAFYKQLSRMPNVRLLSPHLPIKRLIRQSCGVITLTSTAGFEAAVLNRPVLTLGNVFYNYFPNVRHVAALPDLSANLEWLFNYKPLPPSTILTAAAAYVSFTVPGSFDFFATLNNEVALTGVASLVNSTIQRPVEPRHSPSY
jgi:hypothetical protein